MTYARKLILALVLSCGLAPAFAQAPPPVPALPDTERRTSYSISSTTCACNVNFALYGDSTDYQNWVEVWLNGIQLQYNDVNFGWKITSPTGAFANIPRPITDAVLTFNSVQTGTVQIVGARRPRRVSQFSESRGVAARDLNQVLTDIVAQNRETWDKTNDVTGRAVVAPPGETMLVLPPLATRANKGVCFDNNGNVQPCTSIPSSSTFIAGNGIQFSGTNPTTISSNVQGGQSISVTGTNPVTVSLQSNALTYLLSTVCGLTPSTCASLLSYANPIWWGADPTGTADSATAINSATVASKLVSMTPGGTYKIASAIKLAANQRFTCNGSTITQGNSISLQVFIDMTTNVASGAQIDHCKIDGNLANNGGLANTNTILVKAFGASNINISNNRFTGSPGGVVAVANTSGAVIRDNYIDNSIGYGVLLFNNTTPNTRGNHLVTGNTIVGPMLHLLQLEQVDGNVVTNNILLGQIAYGGATNALQVTISGTTATWVSGGINFSQATLGTVLVVNGGQEFPITAVNSNTSLTLSSSGSLTNVAAAIGGGDILSLTSTSFNVVEGNFISGGVTGGIVLAQVGGFLTPNESCVGNLITGNFVEQSGNFGIALEAATVASGATLNQTTITSNTIIGPGRSGSAGAALAGIQLSSNVGLMTGVIVDGNYVYDPFAAAGGFWLTGSGLGNATNVKFGDNIQQGFVNGGNMSGYPAYSSLVAMRGNVAHIVDGLAGNCVDTACTTFGTGVLGGGGSLKLNLWFNGTNWTLIGK